MYSVSHDEVWDRLRESMFPPSSLDRWVAEQIAINATPTAAVHNDVDMVICFLRVERVPVRAV